MSNELYAIPRFSFEFDPSGIGSQQEFSLTMPKSEIDEARPLPERLLFLPRSTSRPLAEVILETTIENRSGSLSVTEDHTQYVARFGFTSQPQKAMVKPLADKVREYGAQEQPRVLHRKGYDAILKKLARLTSLQYQFGIASNNTSLSPSLTRVSFADGIDVRVPVVMVGKDFERTRRRIERAPKVAAQLSGNLGAYLNHLDPLRTKAPKWSLDGPIGAKIAYDGKIVGNGLSSFGQDPYQTYINPAEDTLTDHRNCPTDAYLAVAKDLYGSLRVLMVLMAVGSVNKKTLELAKATH